MIPLFYLFALVVYSASVALSYSNYAKAQSWYFPVGVGMAMLANFVWMYIAKTTIGSHEIYLRGLYWDFIIVGCYAFIPVLFFGVSFNGIKAFGVALTVVGMILTKFGG